MKTSFSLIVGILQSPHATSKNCWPRLENAEEETETVQALPTADGDDTTMGPGSATAVVVARCKVVRNALKMRLAARVRLEAACGRQGVIPGMKPS